MSDLLRQFVLVQADMSASRRDRSSAMARIFSGSKLAAGVLTSSLLTALTLGVAGPADPQHNAETTSGVAQGPAGGYACRQYLELPASTFLPPDATKWRVHASTMTEAPNGDLLFAFFGGTSEGAPNQNIYMARLPHGAKTWEKPQLLFDEPGKADGNPVLWTDGSTVRLFFVTIFGHGWEEASIRQIESTDNGTTWSSPTYLREEWGWMTGTRPFRMSNGEVLLPVYDEGKFSSGFMIADREMTDWKAYPANHDEWLRSPNGAIQPSVVELEPGHLLAYMRTVDDDIFRSQSFDYGRTWSTPERSELGNPSSRIDLLKLANGHLVVGYNPWTEHRSPLRLSLSTDVKKTWTPPWAFSVDVENRIGPQFTYPYLIQTRDGMIHMAYTANRDKMAHLVFNEEYLQSGVSLLSTPTLDAKTQFRNGRVSTVKACDYPMAGATG
jgi:predicted neuraminidase